MSKLKGFMIIIALIICVLMIPNIVRAEVLDNNKIKSSIIRTSSDGSIKLSLEGLTLDTSKEYKFSIVKSQATEPTEWFDIITLTDKTADINLTASTKSIKNVLAVTDTGYLYIKKSEDDTNIVEKLPVNLKLPFYDTMDMSLSNNGIFINRLYGLTKASFQVEKITDTNIINTYLENGRKENAIFNLITNNAPRSGWKELRNNSSDAESYSYSFTKSNYKDGLYLVWIQIYGENCRTIYAYNILDALPIDEEAPTVSSIQVVSPSSGTYKTSQTVKIRAYFSEKITGTTVPTLKIKFGESAVREVTNGTIKDNYIEYSYNIQASDKGQLATADFTGGTIKDIAGNSAKLSCPIISGNTIKANVEGTTTNNTNNQDTTNTDKKEENKNNTTDKKDEDKNNTNSNGNTSNNSSNSNSSSSNNSSNTNNSNNSQNSSSTGKNDKVDTTTANGKIPQTGEGMAVISAIVVMIGFSIFGYVKLKKYKGI